MLPISSRSRGGVVVVGVGVELPCGGGGIDASEKWERELVT